METGQADHIRGQVHRVPPPGAKEPGWYPDPLGSAWERYWDGAWLELTRPPQAKLAFRAPSRNGNGLLGRRGRRLPHALVQDDQPERPAEEEQAAKDTWARRRAKKKHRAAMEARKQAFFETPPGKARLSFGQKHRLFQCELSLTDPAPILIPGVEGTAPQWTTDPVDILNAVVAEGWKLVAGSFVHGEMRGTVGYYLFKRSKKRRRKMNDPWKASEMPWSTEP
jgi:Protein of unknown function (DUF2510)